MERLDLKPLLLLLICITLVGCSTSCVIPMGPDTYTISEHSARGPGVAKTVALKKANEFASSKGKYMIPVRETTGVTYDFTYELVFRLVDKNDPEYQRTNLQKVPDVIIKTEENTTGDIVIENGSKYDLYTELTKLDDLRKKGIITDAEFGAEKIKILSR